jgi:hypothetical protein
VGWPVSAADINNGAAVASRSGMESGMRHRSQRLGSGGGALAWRSREGPVHRRVGVGGVSSVGGSRLGQVDERTVGGQRATLIMTEDGRGRCSSRVGETGGRRSSTAIGVAFRSQMCGCAG